MTQIHFQCQLAAECYSYISCSVVEQPTPTTLKVGQSLIYQQSREVQLSLLTILRFRADAFLTGDKHHFCGQNSWLPDKVGGKARLDRLQTAVLNRQSLCKFTCRGKAGVDSHERREKLRGGGQSGFAFLYSADEFFPVSLSADVRKVSRLFLWHLSC